MVHIDTTTRPEALRLAVRGQLDLTAEQAFDAALTRAARFAGRLELELDLAAVDFIDGSGLRMLIAAQSRSHRAGRRLTIVDASRPVHRLVWLTGMADRLPPIAVSPGHEIAEVDGPGEIAARRALAAGGSRVG
jgi:anti-sigma B factor antagonist